MASDSVPSGDRLAKSATENVDVFLSNEYDHTSVLISNSPTRVITSGKNTQHIMHVPLFAPLMDVQRRVCAALRD